MSPRAAWRLEALGFEEVYDYKEGKLDWLAAGLPIEGADSARATAASVARRDVPTCATTEQLGEVAKRVRAHGWDTCVVVNDERVVFGLLRASQLGGDPDRCVGEAMRSGPSTFRPHVPVEEMAAFMSQHDLASAPVTSSDGRLIGLLVREDAMAAAHEHHSRGEPQ
ncbi:MAG TPA: CBS domain-containing protein [Actinomycetota bacterium]|nr:CBS domain-containing protein [Actinomycetota bacterium]